MKVLRIISDGPVIRPEKPRQASIAAGRHQGDEFSGGENIFLFYLQCFLIDEIIHAIPVLAAAQVGEFFIAMHQRPGDPKPVCPGDDKIIDVRIFVCAAFG